MRPVVSCMETAGFFVRNVVWGRRTLALGVSNLVFDEETGWFLWIL